MRVHRLKHVGNVHSDLKDWLTIRCSLGTLRGVPNRSLALRNTWMMYIATVRKRKKEVDKHNNNLSDYDAQSV